MRRINDVRVDVERLERRHLHDGEMPIAGGGREGFREITVAARAAIPDDHGTDLFAASGADHDRFVENAVVRRRVRRVPFERVAGDDEIATPPRIADELVEQRSPLRAAIDDAGPAKTVRGRRQDQTAPQARTTGLREREEVGATGGRTDEDRGAEPLESGAERLT